MFSQFIMVATETYDKYTTRDWQKIKPHDFLDTRVDYLDKIFKVTGSVSTYVVIC